MSKNYLITGGAGFIGSNYVHRLLKRGEKVTIYDNLSRTTRNIEWLKSQFGDHAFELVVADVRDADRIAESAKGADVIVHLAGQVAVTTSVINPEMISNPMRWVHSMYLKPRACRVGIRSLFMPPPTKSTAAWMMLELFEEPTRWRYRDLVNGCPETQPLDFHSPYGCSKGTGDQYVRDYARMYGLRSVVFVRAAFMAHVNSALKIKAGWRGSSSRR